MTHRSRTANGQRLAIFYEHPEWFGPLFAELLRRGVEFDRLPAHEHQFDPAEHQCPYALVVNRMSPPAHTRGHAGAIFYTLHYLAYLKEIGANVLNGYDAYVYEFSKARQIGLFHRLGLRHPRSRVINHPSQAPAAAEGLTFPVIVKPNIGGSGAGITRFDTPAALHAAAEAGALDLGIDGTALVQEYLPAEGDSIVRVEVLQVIEDVKRITAAEGIEVGGVEYLVNRRDGQVYYYDVNALSNFVADAPKVVGFDPFPRLVDYLLTRAGLAEAVAV